MHFCVALLSAALLVVREMSSMYFEQLTKRIPSQGIHAIDKCNDEYYHYVGCVANGVTDELRTFNSSEFDERRADIHLCFTL